MKPPPARPTAPLSAAPPHSPTRTPGRTSVERRKRATGGKTGRHTSSHVTETHRCITSLCVYTHIHTHTHPCPTTDMQGLIQTSRPPWCPQETAQWAQSPLSPQPSFSLGPLVYLFGELFPVFSPSAPGHCSSPTSPLASSLAWLFPCASPLSAPPCAASFLFPPLLAPLLPLVCLPPPRRLSPPPFPPLPLASLPLFRRRHDIKSK